MNQTPLLLVDNLFDTVNLYPLATLTATSEQTGREAFRVADYRRERSWWQTAVAAANHNIQIDLGAGNLANVNYLWFDRGHNLAGKQVIVEYSDDGSAWTALTTLTLPAVGVLGGDPTVGFTQTEEGCAWALFNAAAATHQHWLLNFTANFIPVIPGIMLGMRTQLLGYSRIFDEDAGDRTQPQDQSTAGYLGTARTYSWRTCLLDLAAIGAPEYDTTMRTFRRLMFDRNQPWVLCLDYAGHPERSWLFQYDGTSWGFPMNRVLRAGQIKGREVGALIT